jgi:hypothetical protein
MEAKRSRWAMDPNADEELRRARVAGELVGDGQRAGRVHGGPQRGALETIRGRVVGANIFCGGGCHRQLIIISCTTWDHMRSTSCCLSFLR